MKPTISVVIPTYNRAHFIGDAIRSVLAQTVQPLEIIVVDDGSYDSTWTDIPASFPSVRYIRQNNAGPSAARNNGIREAKGEWIALCDSDDLWAPDRLANQLSLLGKHPGLDLISSLEEKIHKSGRREIISVNPSSALVANPYDDLLRGNYIPTSTVLARRSSILAVDAFDSTLRLSEDRDLWIRMARAGQKFGFVGVVGCQRRMHDGNLINERLKLKEAGCEVLTRYDPTLPVLDSLHYDIGSAYLRQRNWVKAAYHLAAVTRNESWTYMIKLFVSAGMLALTPKRKRLAGINGQKSTAGADWLD